MALRSPSRRSALQFALGALGGCLLGRAAQASPAGFRIPLARLQQAVDARFPVQKAWRGLLQLQLERPVLRMRPEANRIAAAVPLALSGPLLRNAASGVVDLEFGLRYEPGDQTVRATDLRVTDMQAAGLPRDAQLLLDAAVPALAQQAIAEVVLHQLRPQDLVLPDAMGLQPDRITVEDDGLAVSFVRKPPPR